MQYPVYKPLNKTIKKTMMFLNTKIKKLDDEDIIDVWSGLGAYCGSFVVAKKHSQQTVEDLSLTMNCEIRE